MTVANPAAYRFALSSSARERSCRSLAPRQAKLAATREWPSVMSAAILLEAWQNIEVLQHAAWLGPLLVAALLR
ncbi:MULTISPECIES: DUF1612 domain-containing protein [unclassified Mesorhizobium]|uniref:DUF1612 domain-containing protein n=1 Tax=unclassified Mesorhizobium TaxID=325217 RepID=UPI0024782A2A|nr:MULTISPECIES: DUF1612 domain-containing protein [unclassified Mesorhizobium]